MARVVTQGSVFLALAFVDVLKYGWVEQRQCR